MSTPKTVPVITVGNVEITEELQAALIYLKEFDPDHVSFFAEQCLIISALDLQAAGIDKEVFELFLAFYRILKAIKPGDHS